MEKTLTEAAQLLQKISKGEAMRRDWEKQYSASSEGESQVRVLAEIFRKEALEVREESKWIGYQLTSEDCSTKQDRIQISEEWRR